MTKNKRIALNKHFCSVRHHIYCIIIEYTFCNQHKSGNPKYVDLDCNKDKVKKIKNAFKLNR